MSKIAPAVLESEKFAGIVKADGCVYSLSCVIMDTMNTMAEKVARMLRNPSNTVASFNERILTTALSVCLPSAVFDRFVKFASANLESHALYADMKTFVERMIAAKRYFGPGQENHTMKSFAETMIAYGLFFVEFFADALLAKVRELGVNSVTTGVINFTKEDHTCFFECQPINLDTGNCVQPQTRTLNHPQPRKTIRAK